MKIGQILKDKKQIFSFEFFPPKTDEGEKKLFETIENLRELEPSFVSVTYGAGGSTRDKTVGWVTRIKKELGIEAMAHITSVGTTVDVLKDILERLRDNGTENVMALRGDIPQQGNPGSKCGEDHIGFGDRRKKRAAAGGKCGGERNTNRHDHGYQWQIQPQCTRSGWFIGF